MMKLWCQALPFLLLACNLLPAPAQAQFFEQGPKLVGTGALGPSASQGWSVSLSHDGTTAIAGAPGDNNLGAAWVFTRLRGVWSQQAKLFGTPIIGASVLQGISVSLSGDGNTAIVGGYADNDETGAAWVFTRSRGVWSQQGPKLVGTGATGTFVQQSGSVSLSDDGDSAIVGGQGDDGDTGLGVGAAWVFTRSRGVWSQQGPKLVGTANIGNSRQGEAVSFSGDGHTVIVGGPGDDNNAGAAWVYAKFAGDPGRANCYGHSAAALVGQYGGLNAASAALGYPSVQALQNAISEFCEG
jgi:hypothetical protein